MNEFDFYRIYLSFANIVPRYCSSLHSLNLAFTLMLKTRNGNITTQPFHQLSG